MNLIGKRFGKLVVVEKLLERNKFNQIMWLCQCDCGNQTTSSTNLLNRGSKQSCGCLALESKIKHNQTHTRLYSIWHNMKSRCNQEYNFYYGARKIIVCKRWQGEDGFKHFEEDMGQPPSDKHSIDRIDSDGNYEPNNCKWSIQKEQMRNRRCNKLTEENIIEIRNKHMIGNYSYAELGRIYNCDSTHIRKIVLGERWK
jgi:hypothetical protein